MDSTAIKGILKALVLPPSGPLLLGVLGLVLWQFRPRVARVLIALCVVSLLVLSLPPTSIALQRALYDGPPFDYASVRDAQAIVVLGGGTRTAPEYGGETINALTLERVRYAARVARQTRLPVLVSGGSVSHEIAEAQLMRDALVSEYAVPVRWVEPRSRNTHENAVLSAKLLRDDGVRSVVLVAHAFDMPRAEAEFALQHVATIPAPTGIASWRFETLADVAPSMSALQMSYYSLYEMIAEIVRRAGG